MDRLHPDPSQLCFEKPLIRRLIITSYWTLIILAIPLWWRTTSIERLSLPASSVHTQQQRKIQFPVTVNVDAESDIHLESLTEGVSTWLRADANFVTSSALNLRLVAGKKSDAMYNVVLREGKSEPVIKDRQLIFDLFPQHDIGPSNVERFADTLCQLLAPYSTHYQSEVQAQRVFTYSPRYRLAFSLLNEDGTSASSAVTWDVQGAIQKYLSPVLNKLSVLHNFTIESQVQFHAPLAFEPRPIEHDGRPAHGLTHEDLTVFINSAEWTLSSSVSSDPVIHFVLFVPSSVHTPLHILNAQSVIESSNAFLLPQWGGVVLLNASPTSPSHTRLTESHLQPVFATFAAQLLTLLGVPGLPSHVRSPPPSDSTVPEPFSDWELDALLRRRATENTWGAADTLASIVRLVDQIENMPVGQDVRGDVHDALAALDEAHAAAPHSQLDALKSSARALAHASRAFFNPGMLALLYFPAEHTYAVYTPLFASVAAPLVGAVVREVSAWRKARRAAAAVPT